LKLFAVCRCALALILSAGSLPAAAEKVTLFVIADTGDCATVGASVVSAAIRAQPDWQQGWLVEVGDLAYPKATREKLAKCHEPYFGMFPRRLVVPGNHDWDDHRGRGFRALFPDPLPRAVVLGKHWKLWLLDSELRGEPWRAQIRWLDTQVKNAAGICVIAAWHRPRWSSGWHGDDKAMAPLWEDVAGVAAFTLHGHDHHYEAIEPLNGSGEPDAQGTRSFVTGNGGASLYPTIRKSLHGKTVVGHWGFLRIDLDGDHYAWKEIAASGETLDYGSGKCLPTGTGGPN
jgi:acid phosphatase type 7